VQSVDRSILTVHE